MSIISCDAINVGAIIVGSITIYKINCNDYNYLSQEAVLHSVVTADSTARLDPRTSSCANMDTRCNKRYLSTHKITSDLPYIIVKGVSVKKSCTVSA